MSTFSLLRIYPGEEIPPKKKCVCVHTPRKCWVLATHLVTDVRPKVVLHPSSVGGKERV